MFNNISYNVVIERFKLFADGHYLIKRFTHGQVDQTDLDKDQQFPWMHVAPVEVRAAAGARLFTFDVIFADIPRDKEDKTDYQKESISDCIRLAEDLLSEIQNGQTVFGSEVEVEGESTLTPFIEEWTHTLSGCTLALTISVPNNYSACDIPADWAIGGGSPSTPPSPLPGIILRVNTVDNVNQHLLDLTAGANVTITDLGDGRVKFDATGDLGTNWGTIGGLLSNQLDLQAALDLKADISSLGAVAFSNDYNDLDNLPGTPTLQTVTDAGNSTTNDIDFGTGAGIYFANGSRVTEGTTDAGNGGNKGAALKCSVDYELKWEAGRLYVMEQNGFTIREVAHNFTQTPTANDDNTKGYVIGSRWILDNGSTYVCFDASTGAAVWSVESKGSVTSVGLSVPAPANPAFNVSGSPVTNAGTIMITANGTALQYIDGLGALQTFPAVPKTLGDLIPGTQKGDLLEWDGSKWAVIHGLDLDALNDVTLNTPTNGQVLQYNGTAWVNVTPSSGGTVTSVGLSVPAPVNPAFSVTGSPVTTSGTLAISANGTSSQYVDGTGALQTMPTGLPPTGSAGGDLSGSYPNPNVDRIHGVDMQSGTPSVGEVWLYEGSPAKWQHQQLPAVHVGNDSAVTGSTVKDALNHLNTTKVETTRSISTSSPLSGGGDLSANRTISIADAVADGSTKGAAAFTASDFNSSSGVISIDYTNGQKASAAQPGFLSAADWSTFNSKPAGDSIAFASNPNTSQGAGTTTYWAMTGSAAPNATENARVIVMPCAGTLKNLYIRIGAAQSSGGTCVFTLRKNAADTAITVTFANADGSNVTKSDTTNTVSVAAGDTISIKGVNNAPSSASGIFVSFSLLLERS